MKTISANNLIPGASIYVLHRSKIIAMMWVKYHYSMKDVYYKVCFDFLVSKHVGDKLSFF